MQSSTSNAQHRIRKAAILISTLDRNSADSLLEQMDEEQAARVRAAIMDLDEVSPQDQQQVIEEFLQAGGARSTPENDGVELDESLTQRFSLAESSTPHSNKYSKFSGEAPPFRFLHETTGETLAQFLQHERPQTIAVIVSHLPPHLAGDMIVHLPATLQADILQRVANLDDMDPELLREIEKELESLLDDQIRTKRRRSAGIKAVSAILATVDRQHRNEVMDNLSNRDDSLAQKIQQNNQDSMSRSFHGTPRQPQINVAKESKQVQNSEKKTASPISRRTESTSTELINKNSDNKLSPLPEKQTITEPNLSDESQQDVSFHALAQLSNRDLAAVFHAASTQITLLALTGASSEFAERVFQQLSARDADALRKKMEQLGPLRLRDIEQAQQHLARLAGQLSARGVIKLPSVRRFAMAA